VEGAVRVVPCAKYQPDQDVYPPRPSFVARIRGVDPIAIDNTADKTAAVLLTFQGDGQPLAATS